MMGRFLSNIGTFLVNCWDVFGQISGRVWLNVGTLFVKRWDVVGQSLERVWSNSARNRSSFGQFESHFNNDG